MRILYFTRDYTTHDHRFLTALAKTEHKVYYLRLERRGHTLEDRPLPPQVEQVHWAGGQKPVTLRDGPSLLAGLKRAIRQIRPDLIQAGPLQRCAFLVALAGFRPLVSMSWGYDLLQDAPRNAWWRWATRYTLKHSAVMVGDCDSIRRIAVTYGMPGERIVTFPWGIDLQHFSLSPMVLSSPSASQDGGENSATRGSENPPFTLLSTRNWEPIYGVETIARAYVIASQKVPELRLVMLGNGSQAGLLRRILLDSRVSDESGSHRVIFPGQVSYAELPRYYRSADLYVAATHSDGTSISLLEAMACGCPALVSDIPGNREWVEPDVNGWLFPEGDAEALALAITHVVEARDQLGKIGRSARQIAEQRANWEINFPKLLDAYKLALSL
jgi:glycosyltransferase involved in cell wall biosynthesis